MNRCANSLLFAVFMWALLILRFGYRFGTGDQVELLPYTLFLNNTALYPYDFFIQGLHAAVPNERTIAAHLLLPFVNSLEVACLLLHFVTTILLVTGLEKIGSHITKNVLPVRAAVFLALIPLNDYGLGNVELYSDCFQASALSISILAWAIHFLLARSFFLSGILISTATLIHVLEGLDIMIVCSGVLLAGCLSGRYSFKQLLSFLLPFILTALPYLFLVLKAKQAPGANDAEMFEITFLFRHPHHFIFSTFSALKKAVFFSVTAAALFYLYKKQSVLFLFVLISTLLLAGYIVATDVFHFVPVANFQLYKVTPWVKYLGVLSLVLLLPFSLPSISIKSENFVFASGAVAAMVVVFFYNSYLPYSVPFELFSMKEQSPLIRICEEVKKKTPADAVFVVPFDNTGFKFYAQRSAYVEFKANVRHRSFVKEWMKRITLVYGVTTHNAQRGFALQDVADRFYFYPNNAKWLRELKTAGVTHVLTKRNQKMESGRLIAANEAYAVYQL